VEHWIESKRLELKSRGLGMWLYVLEFKGCVCRWWS
jgi:hypothetical protein